MCGKIENVIQDREINLRFSGKLRGHAALNLFSLLRETVEHESLPVVLDLCECTSLDSIGVAVLQWARTQNSRGKVRLLRPPAGLFEDDFVSARVSDGFPAHFSRRNYDVELAV